MSPSETTMREIEDAGIIAVVRGESAASAVEVSEALILGGIRGVEITYTTPDAGEAIKSLARSHGDDILLGAGTITTSDHVRSARESGARFLVSPGFVPGLVEEMMSTGLVTLPGVLTPSEVMVATAAGLDTVKLFPGSLGGPPYLRGLLGPFPEMSFVPTGGVSEANLGDWFAAGALAVGVGGSLVPGRIENGKHREEVATRAASFVEALERSRSDRRG